FFLPNAFLQTLFFEFVTQPEEKLKFEPANINEFGSFVYRVSLPDQSAFNVEDKKPVLIVLPGLTGGESDKYVNNICYEALKCNYEVIVYINRLVSGKLVLEKDKHFNLVDEFDSALSHIEA